MPNEAEWLQALEEQVRALGPRQWTTSAGLRLVDQALAEHPTSAGLWNRRGDLIQLLEDEAEPYSLADARTSYERARAVDPTDPQAYESLGYFFDAVAGRLGEAEGMFRKAIELGAGPSSWAGLARVLAQLGQVQEALDLLARSSCPCADARQVIDVRDDINEGFWSPKQSAG